MENLYKQASLDRAKNRIEGLKRLYRHLLTYITISSLVLLCKFIGFGLHPMAWNNCLKGVLIIGFLGLLGHAGAVYGPVIFNKKGWEERKMQELVRKEEHKRNTNQT